jgi:tetratricopeptide (TPR) repeat protein
MSIRLLQILALTFILLSFGPVFGQTLDSESPQVIFEKARSLDTSGDPRAEEEYRRAIAARKGVYPEAWKWLSSYLAKRLRFAEAEQALRTAVKQTQENVWEGDRQQVKQFKRAAELKSRSDEGGSLSAAESVELVKVIDQYGKREAALPYAEKAVADYPNSAKALTTLAALLTWDLQQRQRAIILLNQAVSLEPANPDVYLARGSGYYRCLGDGIQAETDFRRAMELSKEPSTVAGAWYGLGDALAKQGRWKEAISAYQKFLKLRPKTAAHHDGAVRKSIADLRMVIANPALVERNPR